MSSDYCGVTPPPVALTPRDPVTIASELYSAGEALADLAEVVASDDYTDRTLTDADALLTGAGRLLVELRVRRAGGNP